MSVKYFNKETQQWEIFSGTAGKSAYEIYVSAGGTLTEEEFNLALVNIENAATKTELQTVENNLLQEINNLDNIYEKKYPIVTYTITTNSTEANNNKTLFKQVETNEIINVTYFKDSDKKILGVLYKDDSNVYITWNYNQLHLIDIYDIETGIYINYKEIDYNKTALYLGTTEVNLSQSEQKNIQDVLGLSWVDL